MGIFRNRAVYKLKHDQKGQSAVEYILLITIVSFLISLVFKSDEFKNLFGKNGKFSDVFKRELEYSYRHGLGGRTPFTTPNYGSSIHDSYNDRFFGPTDAYPEQ